MSRILVLCCTMTSLAARVFAADDHWAFQAPAWPATVSSAGDHKGVHPIDAFILRRLAQEGVEPSPPADPRTLIRRVSFDLIGLPPTPPEVEAFVADARPNAYELLIDRLLASPHYGERWARPWLDYCHYADSDGYLTDQLRPVAWRYRAWLVDALNADMPFDEFTIRQLAGDLLPAADVDDKLATGFLRQTLSNREGGADPEEFRVEQVVDRTQLVGEIWLGLSVGCARCHDHKHDPLSQRDFYQLYAFFNNAEEINIDAPLPDEADAYAAALPQYRERRAALIAPHAEAIADLQNRWEEKLAEARQHPGRDHVWDRQWELLGLVWGGGLGEGQLEGWQIAMLPPARRTGEQKNRLLDYFLKHGEIIDPPAFQQLKLAELAEALAQLNSELPPVTRAPTMHAAPNPRATYLHVAGDFRVAGDVVSPRLPDIFAAQFETDNGDGPPRLALARWLVSAENPLTARVAVNRMWQEFFGTGLVATPADFGAAGARPTHPGLLDWLALKFVDQGWSVKQMHRLIVTSAAYRQSSTARDDLQADRSNRLLARQTPLRLSSEQIRDAALFVSGLLEPRVGGPSVRPPQPEVVSQEGFDNRWEPSAGRDRWRRGLYTFIQRTSPFAQNTIFDGPSPSESCTRRERSNTPLQALLLLNDPVFVEAAAALAERIVRECDGSDGDRVDYLYRLCLARSPSAKELEMMLENLQLQRQLVRTSQLKLPDETNSDRNSEDQMQLRAWTLVSSVALNLHEFITRE